MSLKEYQTRVVGEMDAFFAAVVKERESGNAKHASMDAFNACTRNRVYKEHKNGLGEDFPHVCLRVPTGGGKTLLAAHALGTICRTVNKSQNGRGLALWVVPSSQIYNDTLKALKDREHLYRKSLEFAVKGRIELWERHELKNLTPARMGNALNILVIQLASTNRETKEQLKFYRESGGPVMAHFPNESDHAAHAELLAKFPNLTTVEGSRIVATSVANLVRMMRPAVILDEGHKATSDLARRTIAEFNASALVELSATPTKDSNVLCKVSGDELLREHMIKLPINVATSGKKSWHEIVTRARDRREALAALAEKHTAKEGPNKHIRPIVLVQVERTGKDQEDTKLTHAEHVKDYLVNKLGIPDIRVRIKSSEKDDIEGENLLDPENPIEWIITKSALQEGWDCPFAYILCSLNETKSFTALTQLVGRVLRQPHQEPSSFKELNECYVYCQHGSVAALTGEIKKALVKEGYEGDLQGTVAEEREGAASKTITSRIKSEFLGMYGKPFEGKVYLPKFCVREGKEYQPLDYYHHLLSAVDVKSFDYKAITQSNWDMTDALKQARDQFFKVQLGDETATEKSEREVSMREPDETVLRWMAASLSFPQFSTRQVWDIVERVYQRMTSLNWFQKGDITLVKYELRNKTEAFVREQIDKQTKAAFDGLFAAKRLEFYLQCAQCRFEVPESIELKNTTRMLDDNQNMPKRSLFDYVPNEGMNTLEREVALCLDRHENVLWWFRNLVGSDHFSIQGHRKNKIRPDFVAKSKPGGKKNQYDLVWVVETKGEHLEGNLDTLYKRSMADYFEKVGRKVSWQKLGAGFSDHQFRFQVIDEKQDAGGTWRDALESLISAGPV